MHSYAKINIFSSYTLFSINSKCFYPNDKFSNLTYIVHIIAATAKVITITHVLNLIHLKKLFTLQHYTCITRPTFAPQSVKVGINICPISIFTMLYFKSVNTATTRAGIYSTIARNNTFNIYCRPY